MQRLMIKSGSRYRVASKPEIAEAFSALVLVEFNKVRPLFEGPDASARYLRSMLAGLDHEVFVVLFLDTRHRLIEAKEMFRGTIDQSAVYTREVVKESLNAGAAAVVLAHNHPSGIAEPSQADELITRRLKDALALVDIRVLDHVIIAGSSYTSFAVRGLL
jgi:DNA repair protein RadC